MNMDDSLFFKVSKYDAVNEVDGQKRYHFVVSSTTVDYDNERMSEKALYGLAADLMKNTSVFFNHKYQGLAVAKTVKTWVEKSGNDSYLHAEIVPSSAKGPIDGSGVLVESVVHQLEEGTLKCASVGGKKIKSLDDTATKGVRVLDEVKGLEFSIVGIGANPDAMASTYAKNFFMEAHKGEEMDVAKEHQAVTPNQPSIATQADLERFKNEIIAYLESKMGSFALAKPAAQNSPVSGATKSTDLEMPPGPEKSLKATEEKLEKLIEKLEKATVPAGIPAPAASMGTTVMSEAVNTQAIAEFTKMVRTEQVI